MTRQFDPSSLSILLINNTYTNTLIPIHPPIPPPHTPLSYQVQYPNTYGDIPDWKAFTDKCHQADALVVGVTDLMASVMLKVPIYSTSFLHIHSKHLISWPL